MKLSQYRYWVKTEIWIQASTIFEGSIKKLLKPAVSFKAFEYVLAHLLYIEYMKKEIYYQPIISR